MRSGKYLLFAYIKKMIKQDVNIIQEKQMNKEKDSFKYLKETIEHSELKTNDYVIVSPQ